MQARLNVHMGFLQRFHCIGMFLRRYSFFVTQKTMDSSRSLLTQIIDDELQLFDRKSLRKFLKKFNKDSDEPKQSIKEVCSLNLFQNEKIFLHVDRLILRKNHLLERQWEKYQRQRRFLRILVFENSYMFLLFPPEILL